MRTIRLDHLQINHAVTFAARAQGLIGKAALTSETGLWISPCHSVHTCFMRSAIDVVFVGTNGAVLRVVQNLTPWRFAICVKAVSVLELKAGQAKQLAIIEGSRLDFYQHEYQRRSA